MNRLAFTCACAALLLAACGDDSESGLTADGGPESTHDAATSADANLPPTHSAYLRLIRQEVFREDDAFAAGGTGRLYLFAFEAPPADTRERFTNGDAEVCTYESGTEWPTLPSFDQEWPVGNLLSAGELRFEVVDGPNMIVFEDFEGGYLRKSPGPVVQGPFTHNSFFDGSNLPSGKAFTMSAQGGTGLGAFSFSATLPADYAVSAPDMESGDDVIDVGSALAFSWTPSEAGSRMEVIVKDSFSFLRCNFADDGSAEVPAEAMAKLNAGQFSKVVIQTIRQRARRQSVVDSSGKVINVDFVAEHVQIGRFNSTDSAN